MWQNSCYTHILFIPHEPNQCSEAVYQLFRPSVKSFYVHLWNIELHGKPPMVTFRNEVSSVGLN